MKVCRNKHWTITFHPVQPKPASSLVHNTWSFYGKTFPYQITQLLERLFSEVLNPFIYRKCNCRCNKWKTSLKVHDEALLTLTRKKILYGHGPNIKRNILPSNFQTYTKDALQNCLTFLLEEKYFLQISQNTQGRQFLIVFQKCTRLDLSQYTNN